jgi:hypothetical protein
MTQLIYLKFNLNLILSIINWHDKTQTQKYHEDIYIF